MTRQDVDKLNALNKAVDQAVKERTKWLDQKMHEYAPLHIGDDIYNTATGECLGKVTELYRYHAGHPEFDNSVYCDYKYAVGTGMIDNTSRQMHISFGTKEDAIKQQQNKLKELTIRG